MHKTDLDLDSGTPALVVWVFRNMAAFLTGCECFKINHFMLSNQIDNIGQSWHQQGRFEEACLSVSLTNSHTLSRSIHTSCISRPQREV